MEDMAGDSFRKKILESKKSSSVSGAALYKKDACGHKETDGDQFVARRVIQAAICYGRDGGFYWYAARPEYKKKLQEGVMASKSSD